jgi:hypothetical protein
MIDRGNNEKIAYCCDYKASCAGPGCRCNGGECSHTFDEEHARYGLWEEPGDELRFYRVAAPDLPVTWWEIDSPQELDECFDLDAAMMEET